MKDTKDTKDTKETTGPVVTLPENFPHGARDTMVTSVAPELGAPYDEPHPQDPPHVEHHKRERK